MVEHGETTSHPQRHQRKPQKNVLIAVTGFPDHQAFDNVKVLYPNALRILLPSSHILYDPEGAKFMKEFTDAVTMSARQLVQQGTVDEDIKKKLAVEYSPEFKTMIRESANISFESMMKEDEA
jgi:hypothetical protein